MVMMDTVGRTRLGFSAYLHSFPGNSHHGIAYDGHCWQDPAKFFRLSPQQKRILHQTPEKVSTFVFRPKVLPKDNEISFCILT
jgi:hypothetical protein